MGPKLRLILVITSLICLSQAIRQSRHLYRNFQHEIIYPSKNFFEATINLDGQPTSYSTGFSLKQYPPPPFHSMNFFPPRMSPRVFSPNQLFREGQFREFQDPFGLPRFFPKNLFTPSNGHERPASKGQMMEYKKDLDEQAKEAEMELNSVTSEFGNIDDVTSEFGDIDGLDGTTQSNYVSVRSKGYKYSYST